MSRVVLGAVAGAVVLWVWGFVWWAVLPIAQTFVLPLTNESAVAEALRANVPRSGLYVLPHMNAEAPAMEPADTAQEGEPAQEAAAPADGSESTAEAAPANEAAPTFEERMMAGPVAQIFVSLEGQQPMSGGAMVAGLVHFFVAALIVAFLLRAVLPVLPDYWSRVAFVAVAGLFLAVAKEPAAVIWWHHPIGYHVSVMFYDVIGWALAGLALAAVVPEGGAGRRRQTTAGRHTASGSGLAGLAWRAH